MMLVLSLVVILASGCSSFEGTWAGTFTQVAGPGAPDTGPMALTLDENDDAITGTGTIDGLAVTVLGTANGDTGTAELTYVATPARTVSVTANLDGSTMTGTWTDNLFSASGTFSLTKQ
jgi:hypothetical protein